MKIIQNFQVISIVKILNKVTNPINTTVLFVMSLLVSKITFVFSKFVRNIFQQSWNKSFKTKKFQLW